MSTKGAVLAFRPEAEHYARERCHIAELCGAGDDPVLSVARARVLPGEKTRWHRLVGVTERYVILGGEGRVEVGAEAPHPVRSLDVVLIPPGIRQRIANTGSDDLVFLCLCTPPFTAACYEEE